VESTQRTLKVLHLLVQPRPSLSALELRERPAHTIPVHKDTKVLDVARSIARALQEEPEGSQKLVRLQALAESEEACNTLMKGMATAPTIRNYKRIAGTALNFRDRQDPRHRIAVVLELISESDKDFPSKLEHSTISKHELGEAPAPAATFYAYPPGKASNRQAVQRYSETVRERLHRFDEVVAECRGREPTLTTLLAMSGTRENAPLLRLAWVDPTPSRTAPSVKAQEKAHRFPPKALQIRAQLDQSRSWKEFFEATRRDKNTGEAYSVLLVRESTDVKNLAWSSIKQVRDRGGVWLHCFCDEVAATHTAAKAIATIPALTGGDQVVCIPSKGSTGSDLQQRQILRLFLQAAPRKESKAEASE